LTCFREATNVADVIPIDGFVFDLDGTLIDSRVDLAQAVNAALAAADQPPKPVDQIVGYIGDGVHKLLARSFETDDAEVIAGAHQVFSSHYREHCLDHTRLYPGVVEIFDHFRHKRHAVVSNKSESFSRLIIDGLGLGPRIAVVVGGGSAAALKPDPAPVLLALDRLVVAPAQAVMVGDGVTDIDAGRRAGLRTCAVTYGFGDPERLASARPDHLIHRLQELRDLFV
jgi:phosphoglycolate phosphatase